MFRRVTGAPNFGFGSAQVRDWRRRAALVTALSLTLIGVGAPVAHAAGPTVAVVLTQKDGTPTWNADSLAGHDSGDANGIVRTNDYIVYNVQVSASGGTAASSLITLTAPLGTQFDSIPTLCSGPGSSLSPATMPAPAAPLTSTSYLTLPTQTLICDVGDIATGSTLSWDFPARVRPEVPNATVLGVVTASVSSPSISAPVVSSASTPLTVSARAQYDLTDNSVALTDNTGYYYSEIVPCTTTAGLCRKLYFPALISAPAGGKGLSPLAGSFGYTADVSPAALFGSAITSDPEYIAAGASAAATYGGHLLGCGVLGWMEPYPKLADGTVQNAVRDSGTTTCTQPGGNGTPISVSISGADTTAYTYPAYVSNPANTTLPNDRAYVYAMSLVYEVPLKAASDLGTTSNGSSTLNFTNTYSNFAPTDISGQTAIPEYLGNNYRTGTLVVSDKGTFDKWFAGVPNAAGNTPPADWMPGWGAWEGPSGATGPQAGTGQLFPGGTTLSNLNFSNQSTSGNTMTFLACDSWDNSLLQLTNITAAAGTAPLQKIPANGAPVWVSGGYAPGLSYWSTPAQVASILPGVSFQYGTGVGGAGAKSTCADSDSPAGWFDNPADVPGNDATMLASGVYTAVSRVRANVPVPYLNGDVYVEVSIGLRALDTLTQGTVLPNWATTTQSVGTLTMDQSKLTASSATQSTYDPVANSGNSGDRLYVAAAVGRLKKEVWSASTAAWTSSLTPQIASGGTADFRLTPTLTSGIIGTYTRDVIVEDCLPAGENFVSASVMPAVVQVITGAMPAGAGITCAVGQTYVKWNLGEKQVNTAITPITYTIKVSPTSGPGTYTNTAIVTVEGDLSLASSRTSTAAITVIQPKGVWIDKVALTPVIEVNRAAETNLDQLSWRIDMANIEVSSPVPVDVDIIDVLPKNGLNGTSYTGTLSFVSASVLAGSTAAQPVTILYTKAATINVDPYDTSNGASGIAWCDASGVLVSGTGSCPAANLADATGLRVKRSGQFTSADKISVQINMLPTNNTAGDVYVNQTAARASGLTLPVGPALAPETVIASSIGDFVWLDKNGNGIQDAGEAGVPKFPVKLSGTDSDGNSVSLSTTTDSNGKYLFSNLQSGTYTVTFDPAGLAALGSGYVFTKQNEGLADTIDSDGDATTGVTAPIVLPGAFAELTVDQGITVPGIALSKQVCLKGSGCNQATDADWGETASVFTGETVEWRMTVTNTGGMTLTDVTVTDPLVPGCAKTFASIAPSAVQVYTCSAPLTADIKPNTASVTGNPPNGKPVTATDTAEATVFSGSVGDTVWYDVDGDGVQDAGEPGIQNATVTVTVKDPNTGATKTFTTTTDANGHYSVGGLPPGSVTVTITTVDSDFAPTYDQDGTGTANSTTLTLGAGEARTDIDFGYTVKFSLGDKVWIDTNGDGVFQTGEPVVPDGTVVQLWNATTNSYLTQTTTTGGVYSFTGLPAGDYYVVIPASALTGTLAGAVAAPNGGTDPDNNADETADHNAVAGAAGAIQTGTITLSATLSSTAGSQISGNEPTSGYTNNTLDLALLGAPAIHIEKEVCDPAAGACADTAALATDGWTELRNATFLDSVKWRITVKNTGLQDLTNVTVTDPLVSNCGLAIKGTFAVGASTSYSCTTDSLLVGFVNTATVTGTGPTGTKVTDEDTAEVTTPTPNPGIQVIKFVESAGAASDANTTPGVNAPVGSTATWTYQVSLPAGVNVPLKDVSVSDDNGTPADSSDDWAATYVSGDTNGNSILDVGETWLYNSGSHSLTVLAGQYTNMATALGTPVSPSGQTSIADQDPANIFGVNAALEVVKFTNEQDANTTSGPGVLVGDTVTWRYLVKNTGNVALTKVTVTDDKGVAISCGAADADKDGAIDFLDVGPAFWVSCTGSGPATAGQYENTATATGTPSNALGVALVDASGKPLTKPTDTDPSHYFGVAPSVDVVKTTQTVNSDAVTGPMVLEGGAVKWTYTVTNTGTTALVDVTVTDDKVAAESIDCGAGTNVIAFMLPGATVACTATGTATLGQYTNNATVTGAPVLPPVGTDLSNPKTWPTDVTTYTTITTSTGTTVPDVTAENPDHYLGIKTGVDITKFVNGQDANDAFGPNVAVGSTVTWTYKVVNTGTTALLNATVTDDMLADADINCGAGGNVIGLLLPGDANAVTCTATGVAIAGQYTNLGSVIGTPAMPKPGEGIDLADPSTWPTDPTVYAQASVTDVDGNVSKVDEVGDIDPANYYGAAPSLTLVKKTNGTDNNVAPGPTLTTGDTVTWTYTVTNTGNTAIAGLTVTDDKVAAAAIDCGAGSNVVALLLPGASVTCTATGIADAVAYENTGTATGQPVLPKLTEGVDPKDPTTWPKDPTSYVPVTDTKGTAVPPLTVTDPDHYTGVLPPASAAAITVLKQVCTLTAGCDVARDTGWAASAILAKGATATYRIVVTNTGQLTLKPVTVTDPLAPGCNLTVASLAGGESARTSCTVTNVTKNFVNVVTATGQPVDAAGRPVLSPVTASSEASVAIPSAKLAYTGFDALPVVGLGVSLGLGGLALMLVARRKERDDVA
ncbi:MAG: SdrD B-like domain-containing protein [Propionibacteriaceae bacterium]|nr:DUF11 domain-containing protein [Micropruina sp.]